MFNRLFNRKNQISHDRFIEAARTGDIPTIKRYISQRRKCGDLADAVNATNQPGETALIWAAYKGHTAAVTVLLTVPGINVNAANQYGNTALILAAYKGHTAAVTALLAVPGINVNATNQHGDTALIWAAAKGHTAAVTVLLTVPGINVNAANHGNTALILAAAKDHTAAVTALLAVPGINVNATNQDGHSYYDFITDSTTANSSASSKTTSSFADRLAAIPDFDESQIPPEFIDPILLVIINDPIVVRSGITYDRASLATYFASKGNPATVHCPVTRFFIDRDELGANTCVMARNLIEAFVSEQEAKYEQPQPQEQAAAAATSNATDEAMPDAETLRMATCTARLKVFGSTLPASNPTTPSLAAQAARLER